MLNKKFYFLFNYLERLFLRASAAADKFHFLFSEITHVASSSALGMNRPRNGLQRRLAAKLE
jgi:hypothetical protein